MSRPAPTHVARPNARATALNLVGRRFGRLVVIAQAETLRYKQWRCRCDCGAETVVSTNLLQMGANGGTRSCGCLRRDKSRENGRRAAAIANGRKREAQTAVSDLDAVMRTFGRSA